MQGVWPQSPALTIELIRRFQERPLLLPRLVPNKRIAEPEITKSKVVGLNLRHSVQTRVQAIHNSHTPGRKHPADPPMRDAVFSHLRADCT